MTFAGRFFHRLATLTVVVGITVAVIVLGDVVVSAGAAIVHPRFTRLDRQVGWYHAANVQESVSKEGHSYHASYNSRGYRAPEHQLAKPPGVRRVVIIGDSFVDGEEVGDDEVFSARLQQQLDDVEVINLGVYGYQTAQELLTLQREGLRYDPDLVLLLSISNDLYGNLLGFDSFGPAPRFVMEGDSLRFEGTQSVSAREAYRETNIPVPTWIHDHSVLYYLVNNRIYQRLRAGPIMAFQQARMHSLNLDQQVELYRRIVDRARVLCTSQGVRFAVAFGYLRDELSRAKPAFGNAPSVLAAEGITTIDLADSLRASETQGPTLYYQNDIHWNARGHARVGEILAPMIRELLPPRHPLPSQHHLDTP